MKITDERLVFCNTPQPTIFIVEIECDCGGIFESFEYQYWKNEEEKDGDRVLNYKYCPYCGKKIEEAK